MKLSYNCKNFNFRVCPRVQADVLLLVCCRFRWASDERHSRISDQVIMISLGKVKSRICCNFSLTTFFTCLNSYSVLLIQEVVWSNESLFMCLLQTEQIFNSRWHQELHRALHTVVRQGEAGAEAQPLLCGIASSRNLAEAAQRSGHSGMQIETAGHR